MMIDDRCSGRETLECSTDDMDTCDNDDGYKRFMLVCRSSALRNSHCRSAAVAAQILHPVDTYFVLNRDGLVVVGRSALVAGHDVGEGEAVPPDPEDEEKVEYPREGARRRLGRRVGRGKYPGGSLPPHALTSRPRGSCLDDSA